MDEEDQPISVKLYSESDIGQNLAMLFRPSHSLEDANVCAHAVVHARPEVQDEIEQSIVYGQYHSPQAVLADIKAMVAELQFCKYLNIRIRRIQQNEIQKVLGGNA